MLNIKDLRREYGSKSLDMKDLDPDPFLQFNRWFQEAQASEILEPNAMILATASKEGKPSSRTVLLKQIDHKGFIFFSHYKSRKGRELADNPFASAVFLWKELERQLTIEGGIERLSQEDSYAYFKTRPRDSRLGAHASKQGQVISSRKILEDEFKALKILHEGKDIPLPVDWGGYRLLPTRFEFWQGRANRLHDRFQYLLTEEWRIDRLAP